MTRETYEGFYFHLKGEHATITKNLEESGSGISNPAKAIFKVLSLSLNLASIWTSSDVSTKEKLQGLLLPRTNHLRPQNRSISNHARQFCFCLNRKRRADYSLK